MSGSDNDKDNDDNKQEEDDDDKQQPPPQRADSYFDQSLELFQKKDGPRDDAVGALFDMMVLQQQQRQQQEHGGGAAADAAAAAAAEEPTVDRSQLVSLLRESSKRCNLQLSDAMVDRAVGELLYQMAAAEAADRDHDDEAVGETYRSKTKFSKSDFVRLFASNPDLYRAFESPEAVRQKRALVASTRLNEAEVQQEIVATESTYKHTWNPATWKNETLFWFWFAVYCAVTVVLFWYGATAVKQQTVKLLGGCVRVVGGSGMVLNFYGAMILLFVARHFVTAFRGTALRFVCFPYESVLDAHMFLGYGFLVFAVIHTVGAGVMAAKKNSMTAPSKGAGNATAGNATSNGDPLAFITGVIMWICLAVAYCMIPLQRKKFNTFWYCHHLLIVMLALMCAHGTGNLLRPFQTIYWIVVPAAAYLLPRCAREVCCSSAVVTRAAVHGDFVELRVEKPAGWKWRSKTGQFANVNCPAVSWLEWHPMTISSAGSLDYVAFHIQCCGDWTRSLRDVVRRYETAVLENTDPEDPIDDDNNNNNGNNKADKHVVVQAQQEQPITVAADVNNDNGAAAAVKEETQQQTEEQTTPAVAKETAEADAKKASTEDDAAVAKEEQQQDANGTEAKSTSDAETEQPEQTKQKEEREDENKDKDEDKDKDDENAKEAADATKKEEKDDDKAPAVNDETAPAAAEDSPSAEKEKTAADDEQEQLKQPEQQPEQPAVVAAVPEQPPAVTATEKKVTVAEQMPEQPPPEQPPAMEKKAIRSSSKTAAVVPMPKIRIEGPFGAPAQEYNDYPVIVLVGAGIGITPMTSVVEELIRNPGSTRRAFFYWTSRDGSSFGMFNRLMETIYERDADGVIEIRHFLTSAKHDDRDISTVLLYHAANSIHDKTDFDIVLQHHNKNQIQVGRPKWSKELRRIKDVTRQQYGERKCVIFFCGPNAMAKDIWKNAQDLSDSNFAFDFNKETF